MRKQIKPGPSFTRKISHTQNQYSLTARRCAACPDAAGSEHGCGHGYGPHAVAAVANVM